MPSPKINLSINLNKAIEPIIAQNYRFCKIEEREGYLLFLKDSNSETDFIFGIIKETFDSGSHNVNYDIKPQDSQKINKANKAFKLTDLAMDLKNWFSNIEYYQQASILDDPILSTYEKEFYNDFVILDDDADFSPFSHNQLLLLDRFLDSCSNDIDEIADEKNREIVEGLKVDILQLRQDLTSETKNGFMRRFSRICAKAKKGGLKISNYLAKKFTDEVISQGIKLAIKFAINHHPGNNYLQ